MKYSRELTAAFLLVHLVCLTSVAKEGHDIPTEMPDHRGKMFLLGFLEMDAQEGSSKIYVTSASHGQVELFVPFLNLTKTENVAPGISTIIELKITVRMKGFRKERKGILLISNVTVSVYVTNVKPYSRDVHVAFPTSALRNEYVAASYTPKGRSLIGIVASEDNTLVQIRLKFDPMGILLHKGRKYRSGDVLRVFLSKLDTFQVQHNQDLTGTAVISSQPIAVLGGNTCASIPTSDVTCSHLFMQMTPLSTWGRRFITSPVAERDHNDYFRIVAAYNTTLITVVGKQTFTLNAGEFREFELGSDEHRIITCSKPTMLVQFNKGSLTFIRSEAFALVVPPTEQYTVHYDLPIPVEIKRPPFVSYIRILIERNKIRTISLNASLFDNISWKSITGTNYSLGSYKLCPYLPTSTSITIAPNSSDVRCAVFIMGHTDNDGYGNVGGMAMRHINCVRLFPKTMERGDGVDNDCDGTTDEEDDNGLDDDGDGKIDEDVNYVLHDCNFESSFWETESNRSSTYLNGTRHRASITLGHCEGVVERVWYMSSPTGSNITLATQTIRWKKPTVIVSFPADAYIDHSNMSSLNNSKPSVTSVCDVGNMSISFTDNKTRVTENTTLITRTWTVREECGRTETAVQRILVNVSDEDPNNKPTDGRDLPTSSDTKRLVIYLVLSGLVILLIGALTAIILRKKHVSGKIKVTNPINVKKAIDMNSHYTNTTATEEDCV